MREAKRLRKIYNKKQAIQVVQDWKMQRRKEVTRVHNASNEERILYCERIGVSALLSKKEFEYFSNGGKK